MAVAAPQQATPSVPTMRLSALALVFALLPSAHRASAQSLDDLTAGARVHVVGLEATLSGDRKYEKSGILAGRDSLHLVIVRDGATTFDTLPLFAVTSLQMNLGRTSRTKLVVTGTTVGALAGAALWVIARSVPLEERSYPTSSAKDLQKSAVISIPVLAAIGLAIGTLSDTEMWATIPIPGSLRGR